MRRKKEKFAGLLLVVCLLVAFVGCTKTESEKEGVTRQSIIRYGVDWPTYYDPAVGSSASCTNAMVNMYDPLVFPTIDCDIEPHIATSWTSSDDGLTYTFKIRQDVKFHSGNLLKASDVAFSMNRLLTIGEGSSHLFHGVVEKCYAPDDETVIMELSHPYGPFLRTLVRFFIVEEDLVMENIDKSQALYGEYGDYGKTWMLTHDAGSGPYKTKEFKLEEYVIGERFEDYFLGWEEGAPELIMISNMVDPVAQRTAFANQELEISSNLLPQETYAELEQLGGKIVQGPSAGQWCIYLNTKKPPTDCIYFRKAMAYAFDYDTLLNSIFIGRNRVTGPVNDLLFGKNPDLTGYEYDLEKAEEMLAQSKYANEPEKWVVPMAWCAEVPEQEKISLMFQSDLQKLGIKLEITKTPFSVMTANAQTIETTPNANIVQWSPNFFEAGDVFKSRYHSDSTGGWEQMEWLLDDELDRMIDDALATLDDDEREKKYQEIEKYIYDLCPTIWMCSNDSLYAVQPYVEWFMAKYHDEGIEALLPMGYELWFHDCKVHLNSK